MAKLPTTAQIATIPDRVEMLEHTVNSLWGQVDQINVMLNNYPRVPLFLSRPRITTYSLDNEKGDAGKFWGLGNVEGYIFTCDDDLIYPEDYVEKTIWKMQEHKNKIIATYHGRIMEDKPVSNSYTDRRGGIKNPRSKFHCLLTEEEETVLDIGGTGVMAWNSEYFFPNYDRITKANMADIWVSKFCHEQGCKILHLPHKEGWIKYQHPEHTIWDDHFENPQEQTDLYNSF